ncbi:MAG: MFS transporter [Salinigranum sp.]
MALFGTDRRVLVLGLARMADALGNSFLIVVLPLFIASGRVPLGNIVGAHVSAFGLFDLRVTQSVLVGVALSLFGFLNSFSQPFTGRLSDRTGKRRAFILLGLVLLAAASGAYVFVSNYWVVLALRAVQGFGAALTIPATVALVNDLSTSRDRGGSFGVFNAFRLVGFGLGPVIAGLVVGVSGFDAAFLVAVAGALVSFTLVGLLISDPEETEAAAASDLSVRIRGTDHLFDPVFTLGVATVVMGLGIALFATLETQVNAQLAQPEFMFGLEFGAVTIANVLFQIPIGRASDLYGRRPFLLWGFAIMIPSTLAQGYAPTPATMLVARFVQGVSVAMVFAPALALAGDLAREGESGTKLSVLTMAFGLGTALGPLVSGLLVAYGFVVPFAAGAALAVVALALVYTQVDETVSPDVEAEGGPAPQD